MSSTNLVISVRNCPLGFRQHRPDAVWRTGTVSGSSSSCRERRLLRRVRTAAWNSSAREAAGWAKLGLWRGIEAQAVVRCLHPHPAGETLAQFLPNFVMCTDDAHGKLVTSRHAAP